MADIPESPPLSSMPTAFDPATCVRRGLCPVTVLRPQGSEMLESHSLYYEQHGHGTRHKVVFVMGLNSSSFAWTPQVDYFGKDEKNGGSAVGATVLAFDNRGVGNSGYPKGPYTTSGMAEDLICLLDYLGWTGERELNIVGISLGGMIAQEVASRIPERIATLVLSVTTPGGHIWQNFPPMVGFLTLGRLLFTPDPVKKIPIVLGMLYPNKWLDEKAEDDSQGRTNRQIQTEAYLRRVAITKPQQFAGHVSQLAAALTHRVTPDRLASISKSIPKVVILTGDDDHLVAPRHSRELKAGMPEAELLEWQDTGHGINHQRLKRFNELLERTWEEGKNILEGRAA
ncbi:alpha/beta-hydrolase [Coprinopsis marcescibilis]|uniref:Alpha/beta-hydrolase n=1 Tax=Coprinopsis marcescibilis TaxID=230819 RepID=A0A5C3L786_COPMA|nr:alpha/beta-hydrolase [Coprinopsis marcescibilis]